MGRRKSLQGGIGGLSGGGGGSGGGGSKQIRLRSVQMVPVAEEKEDSSDSDESDDLARAKSVAEKSVMSEDTLKSGTIDDRQETLSRAPSRGTIFSMRSGVQSIGGRSGKYATRMAAFLANPEATLPVHPWCGKCLPVRPDSFLALKPDELSIVSSAKLKANSRLVERRVSAGLAANDIVQMQQAEGHVVSEGSQSQAERLLWIKKAGQPLFKENVQRLQQFEKRLEETALQPTAFSQLIVGEIEELELLGTMTRSRFSAEPYDGPDRKMTEEGDDLDSEAISVPPILKTLETRQVSNLDRFCQNHAKQIYIKSSAAQNVVHAKEGKRAKNVFTFGSVLQLLKGKQDGTNSEQENYFLMSRLKQAPLLSDIPEHLLEDVVSKISGQIFASGSLVFRESDEAETIVVCLQGEIELTSEGKDQLAADLTKEAPVTLCPEDVIDKQVEKSRPFLLRPADQRMRSRTAKAAGGVDASPTASCLIFPIEALEIVSKHYRAIEARERWQLVGEFFAKSLRVSPQVCAKHQQIFDVQDFPRSHVFFQAGSKPKLEDAKLYLVVAGELQIIYPPRKVGVLGRRKGKAKKEICGRGKFIGDAAIFGESYPYSVVTTKDTKVLVLLASDYLHKIMNRLHLLSRPEGYADQGPPSDDEEDPADRRKRAQAVIDKTMASARMKHDNKLVRETHWKRVGFKKPLPENRQAVKLSMAATADAPRFTEYGLGEDFNDQGQRPARSAAPAYYGGSLGAGLGMMSLDTQVAQKNEMLDRLEAEHRSHTAFGFHMEDISGNPQPTSSIMSASPGDVVLLSSGAMTPRPRTAPKNPQVSEVRKRMLSKRS